MKYYSPLRYPGGKRKIFDFLSSVIAANAPISLYAEPYAGGAGAALSLLAEGQVKHVFLNDGDVLIYKFWKAVLDTPDEFIAKLNRAKVSINVWKKQRNYLRDDTFLATASDLEVGFAAFYLNRCNRSGILRSEIGPIGGKDQEGSWKIDARFNKVNLAKRIESLAELRPNITLFNNDALEFMTKMRSNKKAPLAETLVYLDPPYFRNGPKLYRKFYTDYDHKALHQHLKSELVLKWVLSYDDVADINELYDGSKKNGVLLNHFVHQAKVGKELIVFSDNCQYDQNILSKIKSKK